MTNVNQTLTSAASISLIARIDALLPQTQCGKCGHPGCKPYAQGIAAGEPINRCPPGGQETISQLAELLDTEVLSLDVTRGAAPAQIAYIREAECIGCTKCIQACPVDAIVGAAKLMHTVLADECTGCDLCIAPCPVDCIEMHPVENTGITPIVGGMAGNPEDHDARSRKRMHARQRFEARNDRLQREQDRRARERMARLPLIAPGASPPASGSAPAEKTAVDEAVKKARIAVAMSRAQLNKSLKAFGHPPIAEQAARLAQLQMEYEATERELEQLTQASCASVPAPVAATPDAAAAKRAKIQLAMARAALSKATAAQATENELKPLALAVEQAEQALAQAQGSAPSQTPTPS
jgi:electron transport complex protein RnfB